MGFFKELATEIRNIEMNKIYMRVFSAQNIENWVIKIIRSRIYNTGIDAKGNKLKTDRSSRFDYSDRTMDIKSYYGKRTSNVTLKDKGEFYQSMELILIRNGIQFEADFQKENGHIYRNFSKSYASQEKFENEIMGLNEKELIYMMENMAIPLIIKELKITI